MVIDAVEFAIRMAPGLSLIISPAMHAAISLLVLLSTSLHSVCSSSIIMLDRVSIQVPMSQFVLSGRSVQTHITVPIKFIKFVNSSFRHPSRLMHGGRGLSLLMPRICLSSD